MGYILEHIIEILSGAEKPLSVKEIEKRLKEKGILRPIKKDETIKTNQILRAIGDDNGQQVERLETKPLTFRLNVQSPRQHTANYWWVNHKQTFRNEIRGGYIWSPKVNKNGGRNQSYINLTLVKPGDIVFSFASALIKAVGIVEHRYEEAPVPEEFGTVGEQWNPDGYLVRINWLPLTQPFRPKDHIELLRVLLPTKYSPIQQTGDGNQAIYLAEINNQLGELLLSLLQSNNTDLSFEINDAEKDIEEDNAEKAIKKANIPETEKEQLIKARRGQGIFRSRLSDIEKGCRLTGVTNPAFLVASHIKPWSKSSNEEKLDGNNGLLLSPHADKLFDKGWIGFQDNGDIIIKADVNDVFLAWGLINRNVGSFNRKQMYYLAYHRELFGLNK